jgi:hypothetical protein
MTLMVFSITYVQTSIASLGAGTYVHLLWVLPLVPTSTLGTTYMYM